MAFIHVNAGAAKPAPFGGRRIMADFSAPQGRPARPVSFLGMIIAAAMFVACLALVQVSGLASSASPRLFIADSVER